MSRDAFCRGRRIVAGDGLVIREYADPVGLRTLVPAGRVVAADEAVADEHPLPQTRR